MRGALLMLTAVVLAACASPDAGTMRSTATPAPLATTAPSQTPVLRPTLPPEWTRPPQPSVTPELPTAAPTATVDVRGTALFGQPTEPFCAGFQVDAVRSTAEFLPGQDVLLAWFAVRGADAYKVTLTDIDRNVLYEQVTVGTQLSVPGQYIGQQAFYVYTIRPLNPGALQICTAAGGLLRLRTD